MKLEAFKIRWEWLLVKFFVYIVSAIVWCHFLPSGPADYTRPLDFHQHPEPGKSITGRNHVGKSRFTNAFSEQVNVNVNDHGHD